MEEAESKGLYYPPLPRVSAHVCARARMVRRIYGSVLGALGERGHRRHPRTTRIMSAAGGEKAGRPAGRALTSTRAGSFLPADLDQCERETAKERDREASQMPVVERGWGDGESGLLSVTETAIDTGWEGVGGQPGGDGAEEEAVGQAPR